MSILLSVISITTSFFVRGSITKRHKFILLLICSHVMIIMLIGRLFWTVNPNVPILSRTYTQLKIAIRPCLRLPQQHQSPNMVQHSTHHSWSPTELQHTTDTNEHLYMHVFRCKYKMEVQHKETNATWDYYADSILCICKSILSTV